MASVKKRPNGKWRARYRDASGKEHARHFVRKTDAERWLDDETAKLVTGTWVEPKTRKTTVDRWCDQWIEGYGSRRKSTVRQAKTHVKHIRAEFGALRLEQVKPSGVRSWCARLKADGFAPSYVSALHRRLSQVMRDAALDGLIPANPCSRRTSPGSAEQRPYCATTDQVVALWKAFNPRYRVAVLLGAYAGLRTAEACGLRPDDVKWLKREIHPAVQYPVEPLKTKASTLPVPIAETVVTELSEHVKAYPGATVLRNSDGLQCGPWLIDREMRRVRGKIEGLPDDFRFHDLRHYFASMLIASGADVKVVQARLRHASAKTTLDVYGHLWPDSDETTRTAVEGALGARFSALADSLRTGEAS